jgi:uncharacterized RDD family membrane protein YckC
MMTQKPHYFVRLLARLVDLLFVSLFLLIVQSINPEFHGNPLVWYLAYNFAAILVNGMTLGKYSFSLTVKSNNTGYKRKLILLAREIIIIVLIPILVVNLLFVTPTPLHDRIFGTKVIPNEP